MEYIYHVVTTLAWKEFEGKVVYFSDSLATEGFIHCSKEKQVAGVLERYYKGQSNLLLLRINPEKLNSELRYEVATDNELFPHIYGTINLDAIEEVGKLG